MVISFLSSLAPEHGTVTIAELQDELKRARLSTDGDIEELRQRAIDHELMIRKSPNRLTGAECSKIVSTRNGVSMPKHAVTVVGQTGGDPGIIWC